MDMSKMSVEEMWSYCRVRYDKDEELNRQELMTEELARRLAERDAEVQRLRGVIGRAFQRPAMLHLCVDCEAAQRAAGGEVG